MNSKFSSIVFLDAFTTNPGDLNWNEISDKKDFKVFDRTLPSEIIQRAHGAEIIIVNKVALDRKMFSQLPQLKCICVAATGYDKIDITAASERGIPVFNVGGYSRDSVSERVFSFLFHHTQHLDQYFEDFRQNKWANQQDFSYWYEPIRELKNKTLGIIGMGSIGSRVDEIAQVLGMKVLYVSRNKKGEDTTTRKHVELDDLITNSDFITLHLPLNSQTEHIVNASFLSKANSNAVLINTSRGGHIDESALAKALKQKEIKAAYLDVLMDEPPGINHVLSTAKNCFVSPHTAWASSEARIILMKGIRENIDNFKAGNWMNSINYQELMNRRNS